MAPLARTFLMHFELLGSSHLVGIHLAGVPSLITEALLRRRAISASVLLQSFTAAPLRVHVTIFLTVCVLRLCRAHLSAATKL